jgi:hypothetical protein
MTIKLREFTLAAAGCFFFCNLGPCLTEDGGSVTFVSFSFDNTLRFLFTTSDSLVPRDSRIFREGVLLRLTREEEASAAAAVVSWDDDAAMTSATMAVALAIDVSSPLLFFFLVLILLAWFLLQ